MKLSGNLQHRMPGAPKRFFSKIGPAACMSLAVLALWACYPAPYRGAARPVPVDTGLSQREPRIHVYFYPKGGQTQEQQSRDHFECFNWAVKKTGFDPGRSNIPIEQRIQVVPLPPPGFETARLAIAGAVLGALIAGPRHAGSGALIGAAGGAIAGAASDAARQESARQMEDAYARQVRTYDEGLTEKEIDFRRAMSACLEGRNYSVK